MKFSLIVATKNRGQEVDRLCRSLVEQNYDNFELFIVDSNEDGRLLNVVDRYRQQFPLIYLHEPTLGLSAARNRALPQATGDLIAFPDDDCVYTPDLLTNMVQFFRDNPTWDGVIARVYNLDKDENAYQWCGDDHSGPLVDLERAVSFGMTQGQFYRAHVAQSFTFDETLGPGAGTAWVATEDSDYLFRMINGGHQIYYNAKLIVRHPNPFEIYNFRQLVGRTYGYGRSNGYLYGRYLPSSFTKNHICTNFPWIFRTMLKGKFENTAYIVAEMAGNLLGYMDSVRLGRR